jgi:hypothetical protein
MVLRYCDTAILHLAIAGRTRRLARGHGGLHADTAAWTPGAAARTRWARDTVGAGAGAAVGAVALET